MFIEGVCRDAPCTYTHILVSLGLNSVNTTEAKVKPKPHVLMFRIGGQRPNLLLGTD